MISVPPGCRWQGFGSGGAASLREGPGAVPCQTWVVPASSNGPTTASSCMGVEHQLRSTHHIALGFLFCGLLSHSLNDTDLYQTRRLLLKSSCVWHCGLQTGHCSWSKGSRFWQVAWLLCILLSPWAQPFVVLQLMVITSRAVIFHLICCFIIQMLGLSCQWPGWDVTSLTFSIGKAHSPEVLSSFGFLTQLCYICKNVKLLRVHPYFFVLVA